MHNLITCAFARTTADERYIASRDAIMSRYLRGIIEIDEYSRESRDAQRRRDVERAAERGIKMERVDYA